MLRLCVTLVIRVSCWPVACMLCWSGDLCCQIRDRRLETDRAVQTDPMLDRPSTPLFVPSKTGADVATQIYEGDVSIQSVGVQGRSANTPPRLTHSLCHIQPLSDIPSSDTSCLMHFLPDTLSGTSRSPIMLFFLLLLQATYIECQREHRPL